MLIRSVDIWSARPGQPCTGLYRPIYMLLSTSKTKVKAVAVLGKKIFGGPGPSSFRTQQRLSETTIEPIKNLGAWARFGGLCLPWPQHRTANGKGRYSSSWGNPTSELRDVTCHMGSHSVTCQPTQVNAPRLTPARQAGTSVFRDAI